MRDAEDYSTEMCAEVSGVGGGCAPRPLNYNVLFWVNYN